MRPSSATERQTGILASRLYESLRHSTDADHPQVWFTGRVVERIGRLPPSPSAHLSQESISTRTPIKRPIDFGPEMALHKGDYRIQERALASVRLGLPQFRGSGDLPDESLI
jgi:hypothetical protein